MTIQFKCRHCGMKYKVKDELAGKKVKCKKCKKPMSIPMPAERTEDGTPILRHEARERDFEFATGDEEGIEQISNHISQYIGEPDWVFHELISDLVHLDVHVVKPTAEYDWYTLVTSGMSDRAMTVPEGAEDFCFAELVLHLPPTWPVSEKAFKNEANYWPVYWLKTLARMPHEYETWLSVGHAIPNGDPPEQFDDATGMCSWMLMSPFLLPDEFATLEIDDEKTINFLAMIPMYGEEVDFKLKRGIDEFVDKLPLEQLFDFGRKNVCKKRFGVF